jgi:hypothetical protein
VEILVTHTYNTEHQNQTKNLKCSRYVLICKDLHPGPVIWERFIPDPDPGPSFFSSLEIHIQLRKNTLQKLAKIKKNKKRAQQDFPKAACMKSTADLNTINCDKTERLVLDPDLWN